MVIQYTLLSQRARNELQTIDLCDDSMPAASLNRNFSAWPVCRARVAALGCCLIAASVAEAQQPYVEAEPNNRPETTTGFRAPANLMGDMPGGDQDADGGGRSHDKRRRLAAEHGKSHRR